MARQNDLRVARVAPGSHASEETLQVVVVFTTTVATLAALRSAAKLADGLGARIRVVMPCLVPFPLALDAPPVAPEVVAHRICALALEAGVDCTIDIRFCRERWTALRQAIPARSLVMIGRRPRWWEFRERGLAERLRQGGHQVAFAE